VGCRALFAWIVGLPFFVLGVFFFFFGGLAGGASPVAGGGGGGGGGCFGLTILILTLLGIQKGKRGDCCQRFCLFDLGLGGLGLPDRRKKRR